MNNKIHRRTFLRSLSVWEKRWHPEIPNPELAFPEFVKYMQLKTTY